MNNSIKTFIKAYKEKLKKDKDIKENPSIDLITDYRERISFIVNIHKSIPGVFSWAASYSGKRSITLDKEDLEYLYNKYSKKLKEEKEAQIKKIENEYNNL